LSTTLAQIYRGYRWQIEVFFRYVKQNLRIKTLWALAPNARNPDWTARHRMMLMKYLQLRDRYGWVRYRIWVALLRNTVWFNS